MIRIPFIYFDCMRREAYCIVTVLKMRGRWYIIFEQEEEWPGPSITNSIEEAIKSYVRCADVFNLPEPQTCTYIEHYSGRNAEYDAVEIDWTDNGEGPSWVRLSESLARELSIRLGEGGGRWELT